MLRVTAIKLPTWNSVLILITPLFSLVLGEEAWWSGPFHDFLNIVTLEPRGALVKRDTHQTPVNVVGMVITQGVDNQLCDEQQDSNHRTDCTDDVQAQAAIQLKKTQTVRVWEKNDCRWADNGLNVWSLMWIPRILVLEQEVYYAKKLKWW